MENTWITSLIFWFFFKVNNFFLSSFIHVDQVKSIKIFNQIFFLIKIDLSPESTYLINSSAEFIHGSVWVLLCFHILLIKMNKIIQSHMYTTRTTHQIFFLIQHSRINVFWRRLKTYFFYINIIHLLKFLPLLIQKIKK